MAQVDFICNYRGCRKPLNLSAWITKCSHIFCEEHGSAILQSRFCPACNESLPENMDAFHQDLNPTEIFKSMILTGLRPEIIIDIIARSMTFRTYQLAQERAHYNVTIQMLETNITKLESAHKTEKVKLQNDIAVLNKKEQNLVIELERQKYRVQEAERIIGEKNLQMQKMQMKYESLRCHNSIQNFQRQNTQVPKSNSFHMSNPFSQNETNRGLYTIQENLLLDQNQMFGKQIGNRSNSRMEGSFNEPSNFEINLRSKPRPSSQIFFFHEDKK